MVVVLCEVARDVFHVVVVLWLVLKVVVVDLEVETEVFHSLTPSIKPNTFTLSPLKQNRRYSLLRPLWSLRLSRK